jgi:hypothetical protein
MEIETARILLSTMITALPVLMTFFLIALFAWPRSNAGWIKQTRLYDITLALVIVIVGFSSSIVVFDFFTLMNIDSYYNQNPPYFGVLNASLSISIFILAVMPIFLVIVLSFLRWAQKSP